MAKTYNLSRIRNKRSYSFRELADCLNVHIRTVQSWYKSGMPIIEGSQCPYIIIGSDAKSFLKTLQNSRKATLKKGECYCVSCHKPVIALSPSIKRNNRKMGDGKESISIIGTCPNCHNKVTRFDVQKLETKPINDMSQATPYKKPVERKKQANREVIRREESLGDLPLFSQRD
jgi:hypothetical protein